MEKDTSNTIRLPTKAHMVKQGDSWVIDNDHPSTVYTDVPVDAIAAMLARHFGLEKREAGEA